LPKTSTKCVQTRHIFLHHAKHVMVTVPAAAADATAQAPSFLVGFRVLHFSFVVGIEIDRACVGGLQCRGWEQTRLKRRRRF
jgi:hypothetical protein